MLALGFGGGCKLDSGWVMITWKAWKLTSSRARFVHIPEGEGHREEKKKEEKKRKPGKEEKNGSRINQYMDDTV